jgi:hypothetical protein
MLIDASSSAAVLKEYSRDSEMTAVAGAAVQHRQPSHAEVHAEVHAKVHADVRPQHEKGVETSRSQTKKHVIWG